jgi:hypothetical protein
MKETSMKSFRILAIASFGLFGVCVSAGQATAQSVAGGSFTLSHEIRWGRANLPAGDYTFSLNSTSAMSPMIVKGPKGTVFELAAAVSDRRIEGPSVLILERRDGTFFVRELDLAEASLEILYTVPRIPRNEKVLAQGPPSTEQVLVAMAKK